MSAHGGRRDLIEKLGERRSWGSCLWMLGTWDGIPWCSHGPRDSFKGEGVGLHGSLGHDSL